MECINKKTIACEFSNENIPLEQANTLVNELLTTFFDLIKENKELTIQSFGKFTLKEKKERIGRNIKFKEKIIISPRKVITFINSKSLKNLLNGNDDPLVIRNYSTKIAEALSERYNYKKKFANNLVQIFFNSICVGLSANKRIEFRNFGTFTVRNYKSYKGRNPKTGKFVIVPEKKLVYFRYSKSVTKDL